MKQKQIFIPTALVASALSTISYLDDSNTVIDAKTEPGQFGDTADAAVSGSAAQAMIRNSIATISRTIRFNDELLGQQYSRVQEADMTIAVDMSNVRGDPLKIDSTIDDTKYGDKIYCYVNCHNACHGSRGWR